MYVLVNCGAILILLIGTEYEQKVSCISHRYSLPQTPLPRVRCKLLRYNISIPHMASTHTSQPPGLGVVLLVGGCGFLGTHLTHALLCDPSTTALHVLDRVPPRTPITDVTYHTLSITSPDPITALFTSLRPNVVFHAASPNVSFPTHGSTTDFSATNIDGTSLLLSLSKQFGVKAFVYTSSTDVYPYAPHNNVNETHPTWDIIPEKTNSIYSFSKAVADSLVRGAHTAQLGTVCLRIAHAYGTGDSQGIPAALDACEGSKPLFKLGAGKNCMELCSMENACIAHILAAKCLLEKKPGVGGEAFNITDGGPKVGFWEFFTRIWSVARGRDVHGELWTIPEGLVWALVSVMEWIFWVGSLGRVRPKGVEQLEVCDVSLLTGRHCYSWRLFANDLVILIEGCD